MPYKTNSELPAKVRDKLNDKQQDAFRSAFNSALEAGKDEEEAFQIAWSVARKIEAAETRIVKHYKILSPGTYSPSPEPIEVTAQDVQDFIDAVNRKHELGVPVAVKYDHRDGLMAVPVGRILNGTVEAGDGYVDIEVNIDAEYDGVRIASVSQICDGLEKQILQGSMEAFRKYKSEAYTGDRTYGLWPVAWAVLPAGEQPAVPPKTIAAGEEIVRLTAAPMRGESSPSERGPSMTLEEALEKIAQLEEELAELKKSKSEDEESKAKDKQIADLEAKVSDYEAKAEEDLQNKADEKADEVLDNKVLPADREEVKAKLDKMDSEQKLQFLDVLDSTLKPLKAKDTKSESGDDPDKSNSREKTVADQKQAIVKAADDHGLNLRSIQGHEQALTFAQRDNPELFNE